jgi:hypothetical protein|tara:strand:- start:104 stop:286 length:183 start_codon:yes stop_codon:yes gene_type:complete
MSVKSLSDQQNPKFLKKRITLKYIDEEQMELFYKVLLSIAEENGIKIEDGDIDYILGSDY